MQIDTQVQFSDGARGAEIQSIGLIEVSSVATGYLIEDTMLKAASIKLLLARSICSGKFLIVIAGDVASVTTAITAGGAAAGPGLIEQRQIARVHPSVLQAISMSVEYRSEEHTSELQSPWNLVCRLLLEKKK